MMAKRSILIGLIATGGAAAALASPTSVFASDAGYTCTDRSGGSSSVSATLTDVRAAHHDGYDRIVFEFDGASGLPAYQLKQQSSSTFSEDASGRPRTLEGSAGVRAVFQGTAPSASAPSDIKPELPVIREVAQVGNFERVTSYGIGLANGACFKTLELSSPARLVIDFAAPTAAASASGQGSGTTQPSTIPGDNVDTLAQTGHPARAVQPLLENRDLLLVGLAAVLLVAAGAVLAGRTIATSRSRPTQGPNTR
jgi:hypothetical protein